MQGFFQVSTETRVSPPVTLKVTPSNSCIACIALIIGCRKTFASNAVFSSPFLHLHLSGRQP